MRKGCCRSVDPAWASICSSCPAACPGTGRFRFRLECASRCCERAGFGKQLLQLSRSLQAQTDSDSDWNVRKAAAKALGRLWQTAAPVFRQLAQALTDSDHDAQEAAAKASRQLGQAAASAVPQLVQALSDSAHYVRKAAAKVLGVRLWQVGTPAGLQHVGGQLVQATAAVPQLAQAIADIVPLVAAGLKDSDEKFRALAAETIGLLGSVAKEGRLPEAVRPLS